MRRLLATLVIFGLLAAPTQAQDFTSSAQLLTAGDPINTPFFQWDVEALGGVVDLMCVDERHFVRLGQELEPAAFFKVSSIPPDVLIPLAYDLSALQLVGGYYDFLASSIGSMTGVQKKSAQVAIWETMGTRTGSTHAGIDSQIFFDLYGDAVADGWTRPGGYDYFVMFEESDLAAIRAGDTRGVTQPQFGRIAVPEPGTVLLLGSGLLLLGFVGLRRRRTFEA